MLSSHFIIHFFVTMVFSTTPVECFKYNRAVILDSSAQVDNLYQLAIKNTKNENELAEINNFFSNVQIKLSKDLTTETKNFTVKSSHIDVGENFLIRSKEDHFLLKTEKLNNLHYISGQNNLLNQPIQEKLMLMDVIRKGGLKKLGSDQVGISMKIKGQHALMALDISKIGPRSSIKNIVENYLEFTDEIYSNTETITDEIVDGYSNLVLTMKDRMKLYAVTQGDGSLKKPEKLVSGVIAISTDNIKDKLPIHLHKPAMYPDTRKVIGPNGKTKKTVQLLEYAKKSGESTEHALAVIQMAAADILSDPTVDKVIVWTTKKHVPLYTRKNMGFQVAAEMNHDMVALEVTSDRFFHGNANNLKDFYLGDINPRLIDDLENKPSKLLLDGLLSKPKILTGAHDIFSNEIEKEITERLFQLNPKLQDTQSPRHLISQKIKKMSELIVERMKLEKVADKPLAPASSYNSAYYNDHFRNSYFYDQQSKELTIVIKKPTDIKFSIPLMKESYKEVRALSGEDILVLESTPYNNIIEFLRSFEQRLVHLKEYNQNLIKVSHAFSLKKVGEIFKHEIKEPHKTIKLYLYREMKDKRMTKAVKDKFANGIYPLDQSQAKFMQAYEQKTSSNEAYFLKWFDLFETKTPSGTKLENFTLHDFILRDFSIPASTKLDLNYLKHGYIIEVDVPYEALHSGGNWNSPNKWPEKYPEPDYIVPFKIEPEWIKNYIFN